MRRTGCARRNARPRVTSCASSTATCSEFRAQFRTQTGVERLRTPFLFLLATLLPLFAAASIDSRVPPSFDSRLRGDLGSSSTMASLETLKVRLSQTRQRSLNVTGLGLRFPGMPAGRSPSYQAIRIVWTFVPTGQHEWQVFDRDTSERLTQIRSKAFEVSGQSLRLNLQPLPGKLTVRPASRMLADIITSLDLESYVRGVLPAEMPSRWPLQALKAQAIAARSYALHRKRVRDAMNAPFHLEASVMDQMYLIPAFEAANEDGQKQVHQAVSETRGQVLVSLNGPRVPLAAFFHSDCGGRTEDASQIWRQKLGATEGGSGTAVDSACPLNPLSKWRLRLTAPEIAGRIRSVLKIDHRLALVALEPVERTASGRLKDLKVTWGDGRSERMPAHDFRMAIGHELVKSTNFGIERSDDGAFELTGQGFGHGAGMCQWGARHLALKRKSFAEILQHYYPKAKIVSI